MDSDGQQYKRVDWGVRPPPARFFPLRPALPGCTAKESCVPAGKSWSILP
jgi:hypothetical protein